MNGSAIEDLPKLPEIIFGGAHLGVPGPFGFLARKKINKHLQLLDELTSLDGCVVDTAAIYHFGGSERLIGTWNERNRNSDLAIITKGCTVSLLTGKSRVTPENFQSDFQQSLTRLKVDRVLGYLLHRYDVTRPPERVLELIAQQVVSGSIAHWGVSNITHLQLCQLLDYCHRKSLPSPRFVSNHDSLFEWNRVPWKGCVSIAGSQRQEWLKLFSQNQIFSLPWSPLGNGFLAKQPGENFSNTVYGTERNLSRKRKLEAMASEKGISVAGLALAFLKSQHKHTYPICRTSSVKHFRQNLRESTVRLTQEELVWLENDSNESATPR